MKLPMIYMGLLLSALVLPLASNADTSESPIESLVTSMNEQYQQNIDASEIARQETIKDINNNCSYAYKKLHDRAKLSNQAIQNLHVLLDICESFSQQNAITTAISTRGTQLVAYPDADYSLKNNTVSTINFTKANLILKDGSKIPLNNCQVSMRVYQKNFMMKSLVSTEDHLSDFVTSIFCSTGKEQFSRDFFSPKNDVQKILSCVKWSGDDTLLLSWIPNTLRPCSTYVIKQSKEVILHIDDDMI